MPETQTLDDMWLVHYTKGEGDVHGLLVLQGGKRRKHAETAFQNLAEAHGNLFPHLKMKAISFEKMESAEQVDRAKADLKVKFPNQMFADEAFPDNPNASLFQPVDGLDAGGRAEEEIIRQLCDGNWRF